MAETGTPDAARGALWPRLLGEFFVIVFGVLVALAADSWNDSRLDRVDEAEYLARLESAVVNDTANFRFILDWMDRKETGLRRLDALLSSPGAVADPDTLVADLTAAANFGWNVGPLAETATFEDLRSSGRLSLIRNRNLRGQVIRYYETAVGEDRRMEARETQYPHISYRVVPFSRGPNEEDEYATANDPTELLEALRASELPQHVLAERNRARFIRGSITDLRERALSLLSAIRAELRGAE